MNPVGRQSIRTSYCAYGAVESLAAGLCRVQCEDLWAGYYLCVKDW
jgi:hypothetical protein